MNRAQRRASRAHPPADAKVKIFGVAHVFARQKLRKPFHQEVVTIQARGALCHNGCGLYYVGPTELAPGDECPDCKSPPKAWKIGTEVEDVQVAVRMVFGNVTDISFLRSLGPVTRRPLALPVRESRGVVTPAADDESSRVLLTGTR